MAHMTVVFWTATSVEACRNVIQMFGHRIARENLGLRWFTIEVPDGTQWAWATRYGSVIVVRTVLYSRPRSIDAN